MFYDRFSYERLNSFFINLVWFLKRHIFDFCKVMAAIRINNDNNIQN